VRPKSRLSSEGQAVRKPDGLNNDSAQDIAGDGLTDGQNVG